ncbi:uncharacterized protein LOC113327571 isoform X2 [Papaver somniferum]|uniref:uncharacterized protein LOC113327571 isoform X2 n=1 Tax=Papaver somniferum TaxID=3469 RepID=UPI000E7024AE|nr:uncharacterized protein LOC113327571 isoform X2 [Papaver somniferum]
MRSPRLRELAENEKDEQRKACNERRRALRARRKFEKQNMAAVVPLRRSQRLTPQAQIPQNLDCDASRKRKGKAVVHDNRPRKEGRFEVQRCIEIVPLRRILRLTPQTQIPQNLDCDASRKRKGKAVVHDNQPRKKTSSEVVRCCILVKHIVRSLTLSLRSKQEVEEDRAARCVRNLMKRYLRLQESPLARRRSSRIEQARYIRENPSCDGLIDVPGRADIPLTFASSEVGGFFDLPGATSSRGIKRLTASVATVGTLFLHDIQLRYPSRRPNTACQRRYRASGTMHQRIVRRAMNNMHQRKYHRRRTQTSNEEI